jgi:hypothetical protein
MNLAQLEEKVVALEKTVLAIQAELHKTNGAVSQTKKDDSFPKEEDIIPGAEYDLVLDVPPMEVQRYKAKLVSITRAPAELALTDEEWKLYGGEDNDE